MFKYAVREMSFSELCFCPNATLLSCYIYLHQLTGTVNSYCNSSVVSVTTNYFRVPLLLSLRPVVYAVKNKEIG